jgi:hypothetical protein
MGWSLVDRKARGRRLKAAREAAGYRTAARAAEALDVAWEAYAGHEGGRRGFDRRIEQYAEAFDVSVEWLLNGLGHGPWGIVVKAATVADGQGNAQADAIHRAIGSAGGKRGRAGWPMRAEREIVAGALSRTAGFRVTVWGQVGAKELARLFDRLELERQALLDDE